jgi:hypothetical protein
VADYLELLSMPQEVDTSPIDLDALTALARAHQVSDAVRSRAQQWRATLSAWRSRVASEAWTPDPIVAAHGLSRLCRFTGLLPYGDASAPKFYSVADHSRLVAFILEQQGHDPLTQLHGLVHDAHEAWFMDIATPVKQWLGPDVRAAEDALEARVIAHLGHPTLQLDNALCRGGPVAQADRIALVSEVLAMGMPPDLFEPLVSQYAAQAVPLQDLQRLRLLRTGHVGRQDREESAALWLAQWAALRAAAPQPLLTEV